MKNIEKTLGIEFEHFGDSYIGKVEFNGLMDTLILLKTVFDKDENLIFIGEFLKEVDKLEDDLIIVFRYKKKYDIVLVSRSSNKSSLPFISSLFSSADMFEKEIYDYYGRIVEGKNDYTLRLHYYDDNFFPKRNLGKPMIKLKNPFMFKSVPNNDLVEVPVGPIHAGIIPPGHFRFTCDGEDVLNLDIQLGFLHRGVEQYFIQEKDWNNLLLATQDIVGDSVVSYTTNFVRLIEENSGIEISDSTKLTRVIMLELERIYNHLWTFGAIHNDIGQGFILNGALSIRESILEMNEVIFGSRLMKNFISIGENKGFIDKSKKAYMIDILTKAKKRFENLVDLRKSSSGIYDRLKHAGIVSYNTARLIGAVGLGARASGIAIDHRLTDEYYMGLDVKIRLGKQGDVLDRTKIRHNEIINSIDLILSILGDDHIYSFAQKSNKIRIKLPKNRYIFSKTEGHRGEIFMVVHTDLDGNIDYFKIKDPSFLNWTMLEHSVLNNIIADFPVCNKSFDLSYAGFDL